MGSPVEGTADKCQYCNKGSCGLPGHSRRMSHLERGWHKSASGNENHSHVTEEADVAVEPLIFLGKTGDHGVEGSTSLHTSVMWGLGLSGPGGGIPDAGYHCSGSCQEASHCFLPCDMPCVSFPIKEERKTKQNPQIPLSLTCLRKYFCFTFFFKSKKLIFKKTFFIFRKVLDSQKKQGEAT